MAAIEFCWPEGKGGAFTSSWDDGTIYDYQLVELFNQRGLKATWNLNSGLFRERSGSSRYIRADEVAHLYKGHEVACHTVTHPHLDAIPTAQITRELLEDRRALEKLVAYPVRGLALPCGAYNQKVLDCCRACDLLYSRPTKLSDGFGLPASFLEWYPTCHHNSGLVQKWQEFKKNKTQDKLFFAWGHSYEFDREHNWALIASFLDTLQADPKIWAATNMEVYEYVSAWRSLACSVEGDVLRNVTSEKLWVRADGELVTIGAGEVVRL